MLEHEAQEKQSFRVPTILPDALAAFHEAHFSDTSVHAFEQRFISCSENLDFYDEMTNGQMEEEDDLGYYADGVKRTLTDEQIEIFRHSELRDLKRTRDETEKQPGKTEKPSEEAQVSDQVSLTAALSKKRKGKKGKRRGDKPITREPKPDLRKRTWDVVEAGLDSLDYD